jgi:hypothetical protein
MLSRFHYLLIVTMALILWLGFAGLKARPALAHTRVEVGPYVVIVGWRNEPVIVGERNTILIEVNRAEVPVEGLEASLKVQVLYAGRAFIGNLSPTPGSPGVYQVEIYPTARGQYQVQLLGMIEDTAIDEVVEPEEVLSPGVLQFPEVQPEPNVLKNSVDALEAQLQTATTLAIVGIVVGVLGLGAAVFSLLRRPKST